MSYWFGGGGGRLVFIVMDILSQLFGSQGIALVSLSQLIRIIIAMDWLGCLNVSDTL